MSKESGVIILGLFIAVLPFLGFPQSWRDIFFLLAGLGLAAIGFFLRADHLRHESGTPHPSRSRSQRYSFVENGAQKKIADIAPAPTGGSHEEMPSME